VTNTGPERTKTVPENKARQGHWGRHALAILIAGLVLVFIVWGAAEIYGEMIDSSTPAADPGPAQSQTPKG
jgi:hypothetical protein